MKPFTCTFFGHRDFSAHALCEQKLLKLLNDITARHEPVDFLVGRNGEFDRFSASLVRRIRNENCSLNLILPYTTSEFLNNQAEFEKYFDNIEICEASARAHFKSAITICNRHIIDRSDLIICWLERDSGGAFEAVRYAEKLGKTIINIAEKN